MVVSMLDTLGDAALASPCDTFSGCLCLGEEHVVSMAHGQTLMYCIQTV